MRTLTKHNVSESVPVWEQTGYVMEDGKVKRVQLATVGVESVDTERKCTCGAEFDSRDEMLDHLEEYAEKSSEGDSQ